MSKVPKYHPTLRRIPSRNHTKGPPTMHRLVWPAIGWLAVAACRPEEQATTERPLTRVEVEPVRLGTITDRIAMHAEILPAYGTRLATGSGGKVDAVFVDEGSEVTKGQLLARISADLAAAQLKQAESALKAARAAAFRTERLATKGLSSAAANDRAQTAVAQAEAAVEMARVRHKDSVVRAPHAGTIAKRYIVAGEQAMAGSRLFDIIDISTIDAVAQLPERDLPAITPGQETPLRADAYPGETFSGTVHRIGVVADRMSRTFDLIIRVPNPDKKLRPGMLARLDVTRRVLTDVTVVRRDAVVEGAADQAVFLVRDGRAVRTPIELGPTEDNRVAVLSGLHVGDRVIVLGQRTLIDGEAVDVVEANTVEPTPIAGSAASVTTGGATR
ncbi:MAG: efflux RND transporter periplasmic adaptor subunit [Myxococcota bacterium]